MDNVNSPSHYCTEKYECIDVMLETQGKQATMDFCICNAFKYLWRHNKKNGIEDVKKAKRYLEKYIELAEVDGEKDNNGTTISPEEQLLIDSGLSEQQAHEYYTQARVEVMEEKLTALRENEQED